MSHLHHSAASPEEVRHASRNADSACPFCIGAMAKKGSAESAFCDACRTSSAASLLQTFQYRSVWGQYDEKMKSSNAALTLYLPHCRHRVLPEQDRQVPRASIIPGNLQREDFRSDGKFYVKQ